MRVWLVNSSEQVPIDRGPLRLKRMGLLAEQLVERGHEVLWWTSTFQHSLKTHRFNKDTAVTFRERYRLWLLHAPGYRRNISLGRLWNHRLLGRKFRVLARTEPAPDVILCSFPTLELSAEAVAYGKEKGVPVVLDVRDMWPDIFLDLVPRWSRGTARRLVAPLFRTAEDACAGAFAILGHAPAFVDWALAVGRRPRGPFDRDFPFGYAPDTPGEEDLLRAARSWEERGLPSAEGVPIVCFFGAVGHQFDWKTVIEAARRTQRKREVRFVLCGVGMRLDACRRMARDCRSVIFPGWVGAAEIGSLMRMASVGLAPYVSRPDFEASIPNKAIEYLSGGLPILTSLHRGALYDLLVRHDCGMSYEGDAGKLQEQVDFLCDAPARRSEMARNGLQLFESRFTAARVYSDMADHLERIVAACAAGVLPGMPSLMANR